ncbi:hypothetical protein [Actinokineospora sp. HUAS TT18]|uniref:hypothetical protein n=1 Tax=Actinokineospora sp. HUAS TT18 TaxID=3447451 RepID=UPI003F51D0BA
MPTEIPDDDTVTLYWLRSERAAAGPAAALDDRLRACEPIAAALGLRLCPVTVDDVVVIQYDETARVSVQGAWVDPLKSIFHTGFASGAAQQPDQWRLLTTSAILEAAGFLVTVPATHAVAGNDSIVGLLRLDVDGVRGLPSVRLCTREIEVHRDRLRLEDWDLDFPVVVRPAYPGEAGKVFVAENQRRLSTILQLAGASELTILVQPWLGADAVEHAVHCVDGEPQGLTGELADRLAGPARALATESGLAYVRVDFVQRGDEFWFSQVDYTGFTAADDADTVRLQLGAYRQSFDRFAEAGTHRRWTFA